MSNNRILIVDDEPKNLKILRIRLKDGYEIEEAATGEEALEKIESFNPALVLLDIMMPGIDGYEVTRRIKANPKTQNCKVVLLSGKALLEEKLEGYKSGAEDYITKPFNGEELLAKIKVFIKLFNLEDRLERINEDLEEEIKVRTELLLKNERMAYVGMQAGEIVHNLKNPLSIIFGYLGHLKRKHPEITEIEKLEKASDKLLDIIKSIMTSLNRDIQNEMVDLSMNQIVEDELRFLESIDKQYKSWIKTELKFESQGKFKGTSTHISQIVGNLIKNSVEAMKPCEKRLLSISTYDAMNKVFVEVKDTGPGIPEEEIEKVFEPLFTTKTGEDGGVVGTGLGLSYCKKMVEAYGGEIKLESELGVGTKISFYLPLSKDQA